MIDLERRKIEKYIDENLGQDNGLAEVLQIMLWDIDALSERIDEVLEKIPYEADRNW